QGMSAEDARRRAREEFGDLEFTRVYCRETDEAANRAVRLGEGLAAWRQDLRYAVRTLRRSPTFLVTSLITLALAIGANTAIFTVTRAVLLSPLPYRAPESLVAVFESMPGSPDARTQMSPPNFVDYRSQQRSFSDVAAYGLVGTMTWRPDNADPASVTGVPVAPSLFGVLGVKPLYGRTLLPGDEKPGNDQQVVIAYRFWQRALDADSSIVGRQITLMGRAYTVVGVMPRGFTRGWGEDLWTPLDFSDDLAEPTRSRKVHWLGAIGRLKDGTTLEAARADLRVV